MPAKQSSLRFALFIPLFALIPGISIAPAADKIPDVPLDQSALVAKAPDGSLGVAQKDGTPIDGFKLTQYDSAVLSPNIAVASDGAIHVAFIEQQLVSPFAQFVFHRQSTDGGKTWSDPKNVSEDMPNFNVGHCKLLVDSKDRVYIIWRTGLKENWAAVQTPAGQGQNNLVYRVLDHGKWSKILRVHPPGSIETQDDGSLSYTAMIDDAGRAQVLWNCLPNRFHPEQTMRISGEFKQGLAGIGAGLIFQATLDGSDTAKPHEFYMAPVKVDPNDTVYGRSCDDFDALEGSVDAEGAPHLLARVNHPIKPDNANTHFDLIEGSKQTAALDLPGGYMQFNANPPKLLVDAKGRKHILALYNAGEHPNFRDYLIGSNDEPTVILAAKGPRGTCYGFQAYQGPGGRMAIIMQTTEAGLIQSGDSWLSVSSGDKWLAPICLTNNAARARFAVKQTGVLHGVALGTEYGPGAGAVAYDHEGHLLLALINVKVGSFAQTAGGVAFGVGGTSSPMLFFYKF